MTMTVPHYVSVHAELRVPTWDPEGDGDGGDPAEVKTVIRDALERLGWGISVDDITVVETTAPGARAAA